MADPVQPLKGDSTKLVIGAAIAAVGLAAAEGFSSMDKAVPEGTHEAAPEAGNDSVESGTTLDVESQQEHEATVPEMEDTHPGIDSSLPDETPVPLALEPESSLIGTELVAESQVETTSAATTRSVPIDVEDQPNSSLSETLPNAQKDIEEVQTQVDDASNIKDEPIPESNVAVVGEETEGQFEIESSPATQAVVGPSSVTDVASTTTETITEVGETVSTLEQVTCRSLFFFDRNFFFFNDDLFQM